MQCRPIALPVFEGGIDAAGYSTGDLVANENPQICQISAMHNDSQMRLNVTNEEVTDCTMCSYTTSHSQARH